MKKLLITAAAILAVLVISTLICSNAAMGTGATANTTLAMMSNLKAMDVAKTQAVTIDHLGWGLILAIAALAVVAVGVTLNLGKITNLIQSGSRHNEALPSGNTPRWLTLGPDGERYIHRLPRPAKLALYNRLSEMLFLLSRDLGYDTDEDAPRIESGRQMVKKNVEIDWR